MRATNIAMAGAVAAVLGLATVPNAEAAYIVYMYQDGANVIATGSGSIDTSDLTDVGISVLDPGINTAVVLVELGEAGAPITLYASVNGPASIGPGPGAVSTTGTGAAIAVQGSSGFGLPTGYVSGAELGTSTDTWDNTTIAAIGVTVGTYTWTWGAGPDADTYTLHVGEAPPATVPEPASLALVGAGLAGFAMTRRRHRKADSRGPSRAMP